MGIRKYCLIYVMFIVFIFLLPGCNGSDSENISTSDKSETEINYKTDYNMPYDIQGEVINGFEEDAVIYLNESLLDSRLNTGNIGQDITGFMTISHVHNNNYTLGDASQYGTITEEETLQYIATRNRIFTDEGNTYNIFLKDYYDEESTGYSRDSDTILLRTNADWDVTPWKVKYINYDIDKAAMINQKWIDELSAVLDNETGGTVTPVIIRESWSFDYNGKTVSFVNASNLWSELADGPISNSKYTMANNYDYNDTDVLYTISAFMEDDKVKWYSLSNDIVNINEWTEESTEIENIYYTFHVGKNGDIVYVPFFKWMYSERDIREMISTYFMNISGVFDLDNDDKAEIILYNSLTGANEFTYDNGTFQRGALVYARWAASPHKYPLFYTIKK